MTWYLIPGYATIECNINGEIRSTKTKVLRKPSNTNGSPHARKRVYINVVRPGHPRRKIYVSRLVLSAKLGRELLDWEEARHINGDAGNNHMDNLEVGCRLNNIIDELELGRLQTSVEQIDQAIQRLKSLRNTM